MDWSSLRAIVYADIFDFPLTRQEIRRWAIGTPSPKPLPHQSYFFLPHREHLMSLRLSRRRASVPKLALARQLTYCLRFIPTIKLVAVTGALAMNNSDASDDIDLMIITAPHTLWLTRLFVVPLISLFFKRRRPSTIYNLRSTIYADAICLNLWLDETALTVPPANRNLYTAHEVAQVRPLINKHHTYQHFLSANSWISTYLPNIPIPKPHPASSPIFNFQFSIFNLLNRLAFKFQYWYMKRKITRERVGLHFAFFHPRDTYSWVMRQYHLRLKNLSLKP